MFLKLGTVAFGGPAAHIAMLEEEVVRRRGWLSRDEFLDYLGACNLIPGPNSTELAIHIGHARAGWRGLLTAGVCFILPAALLTGCFAWAYLRFARVAAMSGVLYGVKPVVIAVVVQALWGLGQSALKTRALRLLGVAALAAAALGVNQLLVLALGGAAAGLLFAGRHAEGRGRAAAAMLVPGLLPGAVAAAGATARPFTLLTLFASFAKLGSVLFGSGYVLLAFLRAEFVQRLGWLSERQLLDAVAVGQVTPGPVFSTATFIGYLLHGPTGALVATVGIFLPAFVFVSLSGYLLPRLRRSPAARAVLDGVNVASLALMAVVTVQLGRAALVDGVTLALAALSAVLVLRYRVNSAWLVLAGAAVGVLAG